MLRHQGYSNTTENKVELWIILNETFYYEVHKVIKICMTEHLSKKIFT